MLKFLLLLIALCFSAPSWAAPTNPNALEPVIDNDNKKKEDNPAELMMELMKAMQTMQANKAEGGDDSGLSELTGFMTQAADFMQELQKGDMNDPQHLQKSMMGAAMKLAAQTGIPGLNGDLIGSLMGGNPQGAIMSLVETAMTHSGMVEDGEDPLMKLAKSGVKTMMNGEIVPDDNPFTHLHDVIAPGVSAVSDNAMVELMLDSIKAAAEDKTGDPLNAVVNYILDHPKAAQNPIVMHGKTIHNTIINEDEHHKSDLITTAKDVIDVLSNPEIHDNSELIKMIKGVVDDPSKMSENSPILKALTSVAGTISTKGGAEAMGSQESMTKMIKTFTENMAAGNGMDVQSIIESHPAGEAFKTAAETIQTVVEDPAGALENDALIQHGAEVVNQVTNTDPGHKPSDPVVAVAKQVHDTLTTLDQSQDPIINAAKEIHEHVTAGLEEIAESGAFGGLIQ